MMKLRALVVIVAVLGACGDEGTAPNLGNLTFSPMTVPVGTATTVSGTMTFTDPDGDLDLIAVDVVLPGGTVQELAPSPIAISSETSGQLTWAVILQPPTAGTYKLDLSVIDAADLESNVLSASVTAQ